MLLKWMHVFAKAASYDSPGIWVQEAHNEGNTTRQFQRADKRLGTGSPLFRG